VALRVWVEERVGVVVGVGVLATAADTVPVTAKSWAVAPKGLLKYIVPPVFVAPQKTIRNVTGRVTPWRSRMVPKGTANIPFPDPLVLLPVLNEEAQSKKAPLPTLYCHMAVDGPVLERLIFREGMDVYDIW
jgi:hypothetical protein